MLRNLRPLRQLIQQRFEYDISIPRFLPAQMSEPVRCFTQKPKPSTSDDISNEPIQYFGSQAAIWRAKNTRSGGADEALWYQPYVISGSLAIFLLYFCVLREESDIDQKLEGNLFEQVSGLEEISLTVNYKYNKEHGLDTLALEKRMAELGMDIKRIDEERLAAVAAH